MDLNFKWNIINVWRLSPHPQVTAPMREVAGKHSISFMMQWRTMQKGVHWDSEHNAEKCMSMIFSMLHKSFGWLVSHSGSNVLIIWFHNIDVAALYVKEKGTVRYDLCGDWAQWARHHTLYVIKKDNFYDLFLQHGVIICMAGLWLTSEEWIQHLQVHQLQKCCGLMCV